MRRDPSLDQFFSGHAESRKIFEALRAAVGVVGNAEMRVSKSQVAFRRKRNFAIAWIPDQYLHGGHAPLVLTVPLDHRDRSPRWKEIVEPSPGHFTHHLELYSVKDIDDEVSGWLRRAWQEAV